LRTLPPEAGLRAAAALAVAGDDDAGDDDDNEAGAVDVAVEELVLAIAEPHADGAIEVADDEEGEDDEDGDDNNNNNNNNYNNYNFPISPLMYKAVRQGQALALTARENGVDVIVELKTRVDAWCVALSARANRREQRLRAGGDMARDLRCREVLVAAVNTINRLSNFGALLRVDDNNDALSDGLERSATALLQLFDPRRQESAIEMQFAIYAARRITNYGRTLFDISWRSSSLSAPRLTLDATASNCNAWLLVESRGMYSNLAALACVQRVCAPG
jgi:hypothetical protein